MRLSSAPLALRSAAAAVRSEPSARGVEGVVCACAPMLNASARAAAMPYILSLMGSPLRECVLRPPQQAGHQRNEEQHDEYDEQDLGDLCRARRDAGEAEYRRDDCYDEECKCPAKHD